MPDCQQVLPSDGVSAWTRDLSHSQREAQEHKYTQTLYLQLTQPHIIFTSLKTTHVDIYSAWKVHYFIHLTNITQVDFCMLKYKNKECSQPPTQSWTNEAS